MSKTLSFKNAAYMAVISCLLTAFSPAMANEHEDDEGYYFAVVDTYAARKGVLDIGDDGLPNLKVAFGRKIKNFRIEAEVLWVRYGVNDVAYSEIALPVSIDQLNEAVEISGDVGYTAFMGNVYYDVDTGTKWVPYVGAGAGLAKTGIDTKVSILGTVGQGTGWDIVPAAQVQAGVAYKVTKNLKTYAGYRYTRLGGSRMTQESGSTIKSRSSSNSHFEVGVRYSWGKRRRHRK